MSNKRPSGTLEWAKHNANCVKGCSHGCIYCYAKYNAVDRFKSIAPEKWADEEINWKAVNKKWGKKSGTIMFPTTHDITPNTVDACLTCLKNILSAGNDVLIVSKPHFDVIMKLCKELEEYKDHILFRFTIGARDSDILKFWEPNAPDYSERVTSLCWAFEKGYSTSVSMEPVLDWDNVIDLFLIMSEFVTDSIWIGTMNQIDRRVKATTDEERAMVEKMKSWLTNENYRRVYEALKDHPKIEWKESMKDALGLDSPSEAGLDV